MQNNNGKITAVIPVRKGSTRCINKNCRDFGNTNLLKLKIETLKKVKQIDKILVSSNCDEMLKIARDLNIDTYKRNDRYCTTNCSGSDMYVELAKEINTDLMLMTFCVTPFLKPELYDNVITKFKENNNDSISTVYNFKHYIWHNNKPINHDYEDAPPTQNLPDYYIPTFGIHLSHKNDIIKNKNIIGKNPLFYDVDQITSIDIDTPYDFIQSELLYIENIKDINDANNILKNRNNYNTLELLDCTIRDGGYLNNWNFSDEEVLECYKAVSNAGFDYFEIGFKSNKKFIDGKGKWCYCLEDDINMIKNQYNGCKIAVMANIGTFEIDDFVNAEDSNIELIRLLIGRTSFENEIKKSGFNNEILINARNIFIDLKKKGYKICINIPGCNLLLDEEIELIVKNFVDLDIKCIYLADTYGGLNDFNITEIIHKFYKVFNKYDFNTKIGIHLHNNNNNSLSNIKKAIFHGCNLIDSTINGLGRGAGNLKSEELILELNKNYNKKLDFLPIITYSNNYISNIDEYKKKKYCYGSHFYYFLSGYLSIHPNYINQIIEKYYYLEVNKIIKIIYKIKDLNIECNLVDFNENLINTLL